MSRLVADGVSFRYAPDSPWLFEDLHLEPGPGEIVAIQAPSGAGKTTLLHLLCGVIPHVIEGELRGSVRLDGIPLDDLPLNRIGRQVNLLMQDPELQLFFPDVELELAFALENAAIAPDEIQSRVDSAIARLGLETLRHADTARLSFGERKLVSLAALVTLSPAVYLLDEPCAGLSPESWSRVEALIRDLAAEGAAFVIADHDPRALGLAGRVMRLPEGSP